MAKNQVSFIFFFKSVFSCVFCQDLFSDCEETMARRKQGVSDLMSYLAIALTWQGSILAVKKMNSVSSG